MIVDFQHFPDYLLAKVSGEYDIVDGVEWFKVGLDTCSEKDHDKMLVDYRLMDNPSTFATEKAIYAMQAVEHYLEHTKTSTRSTQIAYLAAPEAVSTFEPGLQHIQDLGLPINLFTDETEARAWLGIA